MLKQYSQNDRLAKCEANGLLSALDDMPAAIIRIVTKLSDSHHAFIVSFIKAERPSMQSLKIFIEKVCDFAAFINSSEYSKAAWAQLTETRSPQHIAADQLLRKLKYAKNNDSFESGQLQISFTANSAAEYREKLQKLLDDSDTADELFNIIQP